MPDLMLRRVDHRAWGTYGVLIGPKGPFIVTLELPWRENERRVSSIPAGVYVCKRVHSPKFGDTFQVTGVPNRDAILFHGGNSTEHTLGCILTGTTFDPVGGMDGKNGITGSKLAFQEFMDMQRGVKMFTLTVTNF
jgi:hypothetical protein